jgi:hypothetical protein
MFTQAKEEYERNCKVNDNKYWIIEREKEKQRGLMHI